MGKSESENPAAHRIIAESWAMWRESFRMARLLLKGGEPLTWEAKEQKEHYYAFLPMLASNLHDQMLGASNFIVQAPEKDQIERYESVMVMVREMKLGNEAAEKTPREDA